VNESKNIDLTKCGCINMNQVHKLNKWKEKQMCEESRCNDDRWCAKTRKSMRHLWKENEKLKQHFYKLIQIKTPKIMKEKKNNTHISEMTKRTVKVAKDDERKTHIEKRWQIHRRFLNLLRNVRALRSNIKMSSRGVY